MQQPYFPNPDTVHPVQTPYPQLSHRQARDTFTPHTCHPHPGDSYSQHGFQLNFPVENSSALTGQHLAPVVESDTAAPFTTVGSQTAQSQGYVLLALTRHDCAYKKKVCNAIKFWPFTSFKLEFLRSIDMRLFSYR